MKPDIEKLREWLEKIRENTMQIIVEGKKDREALVKIGVDGERIIYLGMPPYRLAEELSGKTKKVIILTDLDEEGKKIYGDVKRNLNRLGVQVDTYFREGLFRYSELSHIEGAYRHFRNLGLVD